MEPTDQELYDQLLGYLQAEGAVEEDDVAGVVTLVEFDHRVLERPLRLHLTPAALGRHLRNAAPEAAGLHPDIAPVEAAWRLFTVHLDEAVQTARPGETELVIDRSGVASVRPDGTRTSLAPEIEEEIVLDRYHERLIQHLADRGDVQVEGEVLLLHAFEERAFDVPLRLHVTRDQIRRRMVEADDVEAAWSSIVRQIDAMVRTARPREVEVVLSETGVVSRRLRSFGM